MGGFSEQASVFLFQKYLKLWGGLDFFFDFPLEITTKPIRLKWNLTSAKFFLDHFQGFAVSFGGGKNALPADIALKTGVGILLSKK